MPVKQIKRTATAAAAKIRREWTQEERENRREMAEAMQVKLLRALGLVPASVTPAQSA